MYLNTANAFEYDVNLVSFIKIKIKQKSKMILTYGKSCAVSDIYMKCCNELI